MFHHLIEVWFQWVQNWGYFGVIILMAMESSIIPVPSELVIPPAAILAAQGGSMTLTGVVLALLIQWLPVCLLNIFAWQRIFWRSRGDTLSRGIVAGTLVLASFDGLVLNVPFLGWLRLSASTSLDLALVVRVFVASLPLLPLMLHWTNSPAFSHVCTRWHLQPKTGFVLGLVVSGLVTGGAFLGSYILITRQPVSVTVFFLFFLILTAYSFYASQMRFASGRLGPGKRLRILIPVALLYLGALGALVTWGSNWVVGIVVLQALTLTGAGWLLASAAEFNGRAVRETPSSRSSQILLAG